MQRQSFLKSHSYRETSSQTISCFGIALRYVSCQNFGKFLCLLSSRLFRTGSKDNSSFRVSGLLSFVSVSPFLKQTSFVRDN